jgi:gliding motility-associated-like protein
MIYSAAELQAILGGGGTISQLAWQIGIFNSNATLENFTIRLKCVPPTQTTLSAWETGMTLVYGPKLYTPAVPPTSNGWNNHSLDAQYDWDGVSSLVVEVCFYNPSTSSNLVNMMTYSNVPNSVLYSRANANQCGTTLPPTVFGQRFNMRVRICQANYAAYTIAWTPSSGANGVSNPAIKNPTANPTTTQTYQVSVSHNGCTGSDFVTVSIDTSVKVNAGPDLSFCSGQQVQLTATPSGSPLPGQSFSYQWRVLPANTVIGSTASVNVTPTGVTSYVVQLNGGPCPVYDTIRVAVGILGITHVVTPITCNGANNGKIDLNPAGTAPYNYQWSPNAGVGNIDSAVNLAPGTYYATVTDGQNCVGRDTVILTEPTAVSFTSTTKPVSCNAGTDGQIALAPTGGTGAYSFTWSNGAPSNDTAFNLIAGPYTVTVYDANNCSASSNFTVNQPAALTFNAAQTKDIRCFNGNDGFVIVSPTGGMQPYTYVWSHNAQLNQPNATNLTANTYTVIVTDANGCVATESHILTQPANGLTIGSASFVDASCYQYSDGTATVTPAGGVTPYTYLWDANANNQTTQTATGLTANTYTVTVTDDSLCSATATVTVSEPQQIVIVETIQDVACNGDSTGDILLTVTPTGTVSNSYSYAWSDGFTATEANGGAHNTNQTAGSYSVTVTNTANCTAAGGPYIVQEPALLVLNAPTLQQVSCFGGNNGSITANPAGGAGTYTYAWSNSGTSQTISTLIAGSYDVVVTDINGCTVADTYIITQPAAPLSFGPPTLVHVLCNGAATGSITVVVDGGTAGYSYSWSHNNSLNSPTATLLTAGNYIVTATDINGCSLSSTNVITQPAAITFGSSTVTDVSCFGGTDGTATVTPSGGVGTYTYTWNNTPGTNPQTGLAAASYTVVVTDSNNCVASTTVVVGQPAPLFANPLAQNALCYLAANGSIDANPSGGNSPFTFVWSNGQTTQVATALTAGTYFVTVTDATGCSVDTSGTVGEPAELLFQLYPTQVSCPGDADGTIEIDATGGTEPYNYTATQDGANFIFTPDTVIRDLGPGWYLVTVADDNGCTKQDSTFVPDAVHDDYLISVDSISCFGAQYKDGAIHIEGTTAVNMPYQYSLDGGPNQYSGDFFFVGAGQHVVVLTNNWGCTLTVDTVVPEPVDAFSEVFPGDTTLQVGESIQLSSTFGPYPASTIVSYHWTPSTGLSCVDCPNPFAFPYGRLTEYVLTITYNDHCVTSAGMKILVDNNLEVYIPNAFTPNGDGNNDAFQIYGQGIKTVELDIFNRWGEKVYESSNQFAGWDGTYKGVLQNPGVYIYNVRITFLDDRQIEKTGSISIVR